MLRLRRNKNELLVLTGAIYSFVAYLTAFALEVLFLVDLARQSQANDQLQSHEPEGGGAATNYNQINSGQQQTFDNRLNFVAMHAHITVSCLAISILYFVVFISSLILIVALILRSTFMLLIWMCAMTTLYLPEFGLVIYVSVYSWGIETRNGQTEVGFYLFRAILNIIFITRTHKLFKHWNYEKNFFRLKSGASGGVGSTVFSSSGFGTTAGSSCFGSYDSPFFVGDSLSTTINPVFSSSTLNLNRYDHVSNLLNARDSPTNNSANGSVFSSSDYVSDYNNTSNASHRQQQLPTPTRDISDYRSGAAARRDQRRSNDANSRFDQDNIDLVDKQKRFSYQPPATSRFYLGGEELLSHLGRTSNAAKNSRRESQVAKTISQQHHQNNRMAHKNSTLSINDDFQDYELDLDYRTPDYRDHHQFEYGQDRRAANQASLKSGDDLSYSTRSLDRRRLKEYGISTEQVVLRPLGHEPFEYLYRPGSTSNLNSINNVAIKSVKNQRDYH